MRYKVQANKTIQAPDGTRFIVRGVQMFDYLFVSFETNRLNYNFRRIYSPADKYPTLNISEPTYYAKSQYKNSAYVLAQLTLAKENSVNLIRVNIEPAIRYANVDYIDPIDGLTYPPDLTMLDDIINQAASLGLVVQLQNANDSGSIGENSTFLAWLGARYKMQENVWINPANELNGANNNAINVNNASLWQDTMLSHVNAIRGAGFTNPICLDPCGWAERLDLVVGYLTTNPVFKNDDNLIINTHYYPAATETNFRLSKLPTANGYWVNYIGQHCIVAGEVGIDNLAGRLDPNLDSNMPSVSATDWTNAQAAVTDFLKWANEQTLISAFNGVIGHMWAAYIPGLVRHDDNVMYKQDGTRSTWGSIYRSNYLSPPILNTGALLGGKMGNATIGTPDFQIEGKAGVKAAAAVITPNASSPIIGFIRRDNGALIGTISGNGAGVAYGTASDYRLKSDIAPLSEAQILDFIEQLNPVMATWIDSAMREPVFIAHEVQQVLPSAVCGEKDGVDYQTVDYARLVPVLTAAIKYLIKK